MSRDAFPSRELSLSGSSRCSSQPPSTRRVGSGKHLVLILATSWWPPAPRGRPIEGYQSCHHRPDETCQAISRSRWPLPPLSDSPRPAGAAAGAAGAAAAAAAAAGAAAAAAAGAAAPAAGAAAAAAVDAA
eukprot:scaffold80664_cov62-Phaeocystis_antarctica.AAC.1